MTASATCLVTGGAGFIGSHLVDALIARGHRVRVLDDLSTGWRGNLPAAVELVEGSVTDATLLRDAVAGCDRIFHLAAIASVARCTADWARAHAVNQGGTVAVLEAAREAGRVPVVLASSAAVYGTRPEPLAAETDTPRPCSPYGCDKFGGELHAGIARDLFGVPAVALRFFNVYGPRQDGSSPYSGVISIFAERLRAGEVVTLDGGGSQTRDFVFVADVVRALLAAMERLPDLPPAINVCTGRATAIREIATVLARLAGHELRLRIGPARTGDVLHSCGDPRLLHTCLGIDCATRVTHGLEQLLRSPAAAPRLDRPEVA